jgi:hypothetical protein
MRALPSFADFCRPAPRVVEESWTIDEADVSLEMVHEAESPRWGIGLIDTHDAVRIKILRTVSAYGEVSHVDVWPDAWSVDGGRRFRINDGLVRFDDLTDSKDDLFRVQDALVKQGFRVFRIYLPGRGTSAYDDFVASLTEAVGVGTTSNNRAGKLPAVRWLIGLIDRQNQVQLHQFDNEKSYQRAVHTDFWPSADLVPPDRRFRYDSGVLAFDDTPDSKDVLFQIENALLKRGLTIAYVTEYWGGKKVTFDAYAQGLSEDVFQGLHFAIGFVRNGAVTYKEVGKADTSIHADHWPNLVVGGAQRFRVTANHLWFDDEPTRDDFLAVINTLAKRGIAVTSTWGTDGQGLQESVFDTLRIGGAEVTVYLNPTLNELRNVTTERDIDARAGWLTPKNFYVWRRYGRNEVGHEAMLPRLQEQDSAKTWWPVYVGLDGGDVLMNSASWSTKTAQTASKFVDFVSQHPALKQFSNLYVGNKQIRGDD